MKRYIGKTDESLCGSGIAELSAIKYPDCSLVIASPMKRCIETAALVYPDKKIMVYDDLRECGFGDFEGKSHDDLADNPDYQAWVDSGGTLPFPNGEDCESFRKRCVGAFEKAVLENAGHEAITFVIHGGTIMAILAERAVPVRDFYDYQVGNGYGCITRYNRETKTLRIVSSL
jgi:alpha-ribazole phosphatase